MARSDNFMDSKPERIVFSIEDQNFVLRAVREWFNQKNINFSCYKKRIFGSLAKKYFGEYINSIKAKQFSDVDILLVVDDDFKPQSHWKIQFDYIPNFWVVYDAETISVSIKDRVIDVELQFIVITKTFSEQNETIDDAEKWGVPLSETTSNPFIEL